MDGEKYHANSNHKKAGVAALTSDNTDFKTRIPERVTFYNDETVNSSRHNN